MTEMVDGRMSAEAIALETKRVARIGWGVPKAELQLMEEVLTEELDETLDETQRELFGLVLILAGVNAQIAYWGEMEMTQAVMVGDNLGKMRQWALRALKMG